MNKDKLNSYPDEVTGRWKQELEAMKDKLLIAIDALKFECGDRCAEQNPCNAKEVLKTLTK